MYCLVSKCFKWLLFNDLYSQFICHECHLFEMLVVLDSVFESKGTFKNLLSLRDKSEVVNTNFLKAFCLPMSVPGTVSGGPISHVPFPIPHPLPSGRAENSGREDTCRSGARYPETGRGMFYTSYWQPLIFKFNFSLLLTTLGWSESQTWYCLHRS